MVAVVLTNSVWSVTILSECLMDCLTFLPCILLMALQIWQEGEFGFKVDMRLPSISEIIRRRRSALFGHVARLPQDVPANKALHCHVDLSLGRPPNYQWKRRPGRPRERWIDQLRKDSGIPPATCGDVRLLVATEEQRYGPRWLCDDDDDDKVWYLLCAVVTSVCLSISPLRLRSSRGLKHCKSKQILPVQNICMGQTVLNH